MPKYINFDYSSPPFGTKKKKQSRINASVIWNLLFQKQLEKLLG